MFIVQVSREAEFFESIDFYLGDVLEIADHSVVTMQRNTEWSLLQSSRTELFNLVELYFEDGPEVALSHDTVERFWTVTVDSCHDL